MGVRVIDISNHQWNADVEAVVRQNDIDAVFILTNDGTFVNSYFHRQADAAERAGATVVPYVYLRPNWAQTIDIHMSVVGSRYKQSLVDVEDGSGGWNECWNAHNRLWSAGRETPLLYWPRYHWQSMGSPDLTPLKGRVRAHWKSWYPDSVARGFDAGLALVPGSVWGDNRGGIPVRIVQFTGTGRLNGYGGNLDLNYFPGSRAELDALLGGDDEMTPEDKKQLSQVEAYARETWEQVAQKIEGLSALHRHVNFLGDLMIALAKKVDTLEASGIPVSIDYSRLADELDKRARDGDPNTGPVT